jgi:nicotinate-nucleotide pyrophosphorylase
MMLARVPRVTASADDPRVVSGELILVADAHKLAVSKLRRLFKRLRRALVDELPYEVEGKTADQIREIFGRKIDAVKLGEMHAGK